MNGRIIKFRSRTELEAAEIAQLARGSIIICKVILPDTGWKRRRWVAIVVFLDGSSEWLDGPADEGAAQYLASALSRKYGFRIVNVGVLK